ncbi:ABC transporter permease [Haloglomus salinum]|uniref:ABC transporter permease n=1 Tax=Haloglomus salinum TaxID=2962673 RepID=UPI0020C9DF7D|nr:ABC transporter permease subunit [Haloglomus salinum]
MTWTVVARKEFTDAFRARILWGIVAIIGVLTGAITLATRFIPGIEPNPLTGLGAAAQFAAMLVPIMSLVAAYLAIAGERESGSVKVLLGLPPSRGEVVLGKFLGRGGVVGLGLVLGFTVAGVATAAAYGTLPVSTFVSITLLTVMLGVTFVGIAVGISAATGTRARAMTVSIAVYLVLVLLWDLLPQGLHFLVHGTTPSGTVPGWFLGLQALSPPGAYNALVMAVLGAGDPTVPGLAARVDGSLPIYLESWFLLGLLALWTLIPLALGYRWFERADL